MDTDPATADDLLLMLRRASLLESRPGGRYALHDLLRSYAGSLVAAQESSHARDAAQHRLVRYQVHSTARAIQLGYPTGPDPRPTSKDAVAALNWLELERPNLLASIHRAGQPGWPAAAIGLAALLFRPLLSGGRFDDALAVAERQREYQRGLGDLAGEYDAVSNLGVVFRRQGLVDAAIQHHRRALDLARLLGDPVRQARALNHIGGVLQRVGYLPDAADCYLQALQVARSVDVETAQAEPLTNLGLIYGSLGRYDEARTCLRQALGIPGLSMPTAARACQALGGIQLELGRNQAARRLIQRALQLYQQAREQAWEADALSDLAVVYRAAGDYQAATSHHLRALEILDQAAASMFETGARNAFGRTLYEQHDRPAALGEYRRALAIARRTGQRYDEATALRGLANRVADPVTAEDYRQLAARICQDLGLLPAVAS